MSIKYYIGLRKTGNTLKPENHSKSITYILKSTKLSANALLFVRSKSYGGKNQKSEKQLLKTAVSLCHQINIVISMGSNFPVNRIASTLCMKSIIDLSCSVT